jgi:Putative translation initiation inhibitor, yjgF family
MDDAAILQKLSEEGLELPATLPPLAAYIPVVVSGTMAVVSGQIPMRNGEVLASGKVGQGVTVDEGAAAARQAALQALAALRSALGSFDRLVRIVQVTVYVAANHDFIEHPRVANGASDLLGKILGENGRHARAAVGVISLPLGASVEVAMIAEIIPA